ncbi:MAG: site-2 protease family protein [Thermoanaerobaculia bacterium]
MNEPRDPDAEHLARLAAELARRAPQPAAPPPPPPAIPPPPSAAAAATPHSRPRRAGVWGLLAAAAALLLKFKSLLFVALGKLKFVFAGLKFLKLGQVLTTAGTMALTIWVYATTWGLPFAFGFVLLIFLHEMGHAAALWARGLRAGAPVFIPFVGAMIAMKDMPPNARIEAEVAIAGPLAGGLAALLCWVLSRALDAPILAALAYSGFFLNLFNLIPVSPLDGGRVAGAISRWFWVGGLGVALVLAVRTGNPILWVVVVLGGLRAFRSFRGTAPERPGYFEITAGERATIAIGYFALAGLLALGVAELAPPGPS